VLELEVFRRRRKTLGFFFGAGSCRGYGRHHCRCQGRCHTARRRGHHVATGSVVGAGGTEYRVARLKRGIGPLACGPSPILNLFQYLKSIQIIKCNINTFHWSKNTQTLHGAIFESFEQFSQLGQLQIPKRIHFINL
jgi:hypothetical protein